MASWRFAARVFWGLAAGIKQDRRVHDELSAPGTLVIRYEGAAEFQAALLERLAAIDPKAADKLRKDPLIIDVKSEPVKDTGPGDEVPIG